MPKRGIKVIYTFVIITLLILLTSCGGRVAGGDKPIDTAARLKQVQSGTQGVEVTVLPNNPPPLIYDQNELITILEIKNKGNHNLGTGDCFVQVTGFDPNIIRGYVTHSCAENTGTLEGKNVYNLQGGINQIEFRSPGVSLPPGVFEYNPTLNFVTCYNYHTRANPSVCVDPLFYQVTPQQKTCIPHDVSVGGGQGGPVGISYVGVNMIGGKAIFEINVVNFNTAGRVLSPYSDIQNCGQASVEYKDLDKVTYNVNLGSGSGSVIDCKPRDHIVRLNNGQGKIVCQFNIPGTSAFETPLMIDLDYNFVQSFKKTVKIVKTPE